jgi:DNA-directed RNA polymerase
MFLKKRGLVGTLIPGANCAEFFCLWDLQWLPTVHALYRKVQVGGMWRSALRQLSRRRIEQNRVLGLNSRSPSWTQISVFRGASGSSSAAASAAALSREIENGTIGEAHWHLKNSKISSFSMPAEAVRSNLDDTLENALYNVVNLPWLFLQGSPSQDGRIPFAKEKDRSEYSRTFASAAEAVIEEDENDLEPTEMRAPTVSSSQNKDLSRKRELRKERKKQKDLYMRQYKIETEAWQQAAAEYKELMAEMCRKSLAPSLPFTRSLLLGWFEPLRYINMFCIIVVAWFVSVSALRTALTCHLFLVIIMHSKKLVSVQIRISWLHIFCI